MPKAPFLRTSSKKTESTTQTEQNICLGCKMKFVNSSSVVFFDIYDNR